MASRSIETVNSSDSNIIRGINRLDIPRLKLPCKSLSDTGDSIDEKGDTIKNPLEDKAPVSQFSNVIDTLSNDDGGDEETLIRQVSGLSPTTQHNLNILLRDVTIGDAKIDTDTDGRMKIEYKPVKKMFWDGSQANIISQPKSEIDINEVDIKRLVESCLELVEYIKRDKPPAGVLLDSTKISVSGVKKHYRLGHEFHKTGKVLGSGNMAGEIIVLKDTKTGKEHAQKTIMISCFRSNEIKCWVDLNDTGYVPRLYMFKIDGNQISIHMEILENAKTLRSIINEHMKHMNKSLFRPFSLLVLDGALEAVSKMHEKGWVHKDLHAGNVMVQKVSHKNLAVKILDFGLAGRFDCRENGLDYRGFKSDMSEILRMFSALYTGALEFANTYDIQKNWKEEIHNWFEMVGSKNGEKEELTYLVREAMTLVRPDDVSEFRQQVKEKLNEAMKNKEKDKVMEKIVHLLFPEEFQPIHPSSTVECVPDLNVTYKDDPDKYSA